MNSYGIPQLDITQKSTFPFDLELMVITSSLPKSAKNGFDEAGMDVVKHSSSSSYSYSSTNSTAISSLSPSSSSVDLQLLSSSSSIASTSTYASISSSIS
eukprot:CAMPEP_0116016272 /NCGR_PEP_ID=MMETSP0321-20121206/7369_1 /TAXON_ID=163516 /ORGANISM="Leptocylindrus danicus var. danicus, Strain B650" /LENGTH=99 /DNA_ID=CAMNT_0003486273 /DNA_START=147 /DNA_END=444 /DNA_ORIENTATION=+